MDVRQLETLINSDAETRTSEHFKHAQQRYEELLEEVHELYLRELRYIVKFHRMTLESRIDRAKQAQDWRVEEVLGKEVKKWRKAESE